MEATLLVTPQELTSTASTFSAKATQVKALHDSMLERVRSLNSTWTGDAASAYTNKFNALQSSMETIYNMIQEHVRDLNAIAEQYTSAETQATAAANDMPASTLA